MDAGQDLQALRQERNRADYDIKRSFPAGTAVNLVRNAEQIFQALDAARREPTRTAITDAMKIYERDVLRDVTWKP